MVWLQTFTGKVFDLENINPDKICIEDIAHSLSMQCRYNGHCRFFYSVAEHSIEMSLIEGIKDKKVALLHDAAEAYIGDIVSPLKKFLFRKPLSELKWIEETINAAIEEKFDLPFSSINWPAIKHFDKVLCATEQRDILSLCEKQWEELPPPLTKTLIPIGNPSIIKMNFLIRFNQLWKGTL